MRELLRSHEQEIVNRVVHQLGTMNPGLIGLAPSNPQVAPHTPHTTQRRQGHHRASRIAELERQLAELQGEIGANTNQSPQSDPRALGMSNPTHTQFLPISESAASIADSVEILFPGVERTTLVQIIENKFKPTNIYRLLASEKDRAESHRIINIGGVEFEQAEREGKESEYRMSSFFKAWAAYTGILVKLAPHILQGELTTALSIYTMNLYDLHENTPGTE